MGDKTQDKPFTADQVNSHRLNRMADVALQHGDPVKAAQFMAVSAKRREDANQDEIHSLLAGDQPKGLERIPAVRQTSGADGSQSNIADAGIPGATPAVPNQSGQSTAASDGLKRQSYLDTVGPRVRDAYLRQGKVAEAKAWTEFAESEQGRDYANNFAKAQRLVTTGNYEGAAPVLQDLFSNGFPNGQQAKVQSLGDGTFKIDVLDQASGKLLGSKTMPGADMGKMAINALSPTKLVEFTVQQRAQRDKEAVLLDRQTQLEELRQKGQDAREDRRDERLGMRLDRQSEDLEKRLAARGGLTQSQERGNAEIDAAREMVSGMDPAEIRRRTAKQTNTGRENPDYDPALSRAASLAGRRKIGTDDVFDNRQGQPSGETFMGKPLTDMTEGQLQQYRRAAGPEAKTRIDGELKRRNSAASSDFNSIAERFLAEGMADHRLGKEIHTGKDRDGKTVTGYPVIDKSGRVVGIYN